MSIHTDNHCDCAVQRDIPALRLNTLCLCPQQPATLGSALQVAAVPVFVASADLEKMAQLVHSIDAVVASPAWREYVLADAPGIARHNPGNAGVLFGYDFHLHANGPQLIEINTNAGGAFIVAQVLHGQSGCCASGTWQSPSCQATAAEDAIIDSFLADYAMAVHGQERHQQTPCLIAIVDVDPTQQYLYPEFQRCAELLRARGLRVEICAPETLQYTNGELQLHGEAVDLIYNRLTDFYFESETSAAIRAAYLDNAVVVTPNPHQHALYADKSHLAILTDPDQLAALGVDKTQREILLAGIPQTRRVDPAHADFLWQQRKQFFFKPATAYGGKGAYRGAKLTRGTFEQLLTEDYVAQLEVEPPLRKARVDGETTDLKIDVRCYVYRGEIQLTAARLWRGQTTNFRTPGGGFATISATAT